MKEPKLFAQIREARERAETAMPSASPPPGLPPMTATVVTPEKPAPPHNYIAKTLKECDSVEHCQTLLDHAKQHGYAEDGQTVQLIRAKIEQLRSAGRTPAAKTAKKRRGR